MQKSDSPLKAKPSNAKRLVGKGRHVGQVLDPSTLDAEIKREAKLEENQAGAPIDTVESAAMGESGGSAGVAIKPEFPPEEARGDPLGHDHETPREAPGAEEATAGGDMPAHD